ncbi:MAG TPA: hypothetical protein VK524_01180 [Polyangiaceae bacterium]|nr:hypothetical protein [Polyangiaceae bacterium]
MTLVRSSAGSLHGLDERRKQRSSDTLVALSRLLESARVKNDVPALAVADPSGLLVAGAGAFQACEELAAHAPLLLSPPANDVVPTRLDVLSRRSEIWRISVDGVEVLVCGEGGERTRRTRALEDIASGCQRILGARRPMSV